MLATSRTAPVGQGADRRRDVRAGRARAVVADALLAAVIFAAVILVVPTALSAPVAVQSDAGVFYSVFHQLGQGRRLYAEVFDHKDPLFYAPHTAAYATLGLVGPMAWETVLSAGLVLGVVMLGGRLGLGPLGRLVMAATFAALHFLPGVYVPLHTYQQGIALLVAALALAACGRPLVGGVLFGAAVMSKLPLAALLPALLLVAATGRVPAATWRATARRAVHAAVGMAASVALVLIALLARGELAGYGDAVLQNLAYPVLNVSAATSFRRNSTLRERSTTVFTTPVVATYLGLLGLSAAIGVGALVGPGRPLRGSAPALAPPEVRAAVLALAVGLGVLVMLRTASWWSHHFQVAALAFALALVPPLVLLGRLARPLALGGTLAVALGLAWLFATPSLAGAYTPQPLGLRAADPCDLLARSGRGGQTSRRECSLLGETWPPGTRFATIQQNESGALAAWTGPEIRLACRVFYQFPWFRPELLDELADCLERGDVDVVLRAPFGYDVPRLQRRLDRVLRSEFELVRRHGDVEVWQRR